MVETSAIGGDFGGKGLTIDEFPCYFLAKATAPVLRADVCRGVAQRANAPPHRCHVTHCGGCRRNVSRARVDRALRRWRLRGRETDPPLVPNGYGAIPRIPTCVSIFARCTRTLPAGRARRARSRRSHAREQHVEMIAEALGRDPLESAAKTSCARRRHDAQWRAGQRIVGRRRSGRARTRTSA